MSRNRAQHLRSNVALARPAPATRETGEIFLNFKDRQIGYIDPARAPVDLLVARQFSAETSYLANEYVYQQGRLYRSATNISPGPFDASKWYFVVDQNSAGLLTTGVYVSDNPPSNPFHGQLWWESDTGNTFVYVIEPSSRQWVQVNIIPGAAPFVFFSRDDLVAKITGGLSLVPGAIYIAPPVSYIAVPGATDIPDLPGLLPYGDLHVEHFGAKADMTWAYRTFDRTETGTFEGPYRLTGTNNLVPFQRTDAYALKTGKGFFYAEEGKHPNNTPGIHGGGYYLGGQWLMDCKIVSRNDYRNDLWVHGKSALHSGIFINSNNGGVVGFRIIDQWEKSSPEEPSKPFGHGQAGPGITISSIVNSNGGPGLYSLTPVAILENIEIDCKFCRAGFGTPAGLPTQGGLSAYHFVGAGGIEFCKFKLGTFGHTNTASNGLGLCHWSMQYQNGDPNSPTGWFDMELIESQHCINCTIEFLNHYDQTKMTGDGTQGFSCYFELASGGAARIGDINVKGCFPLAITPGDCINYKANPRQKEKVMKGIRIGYVSAIDTPLRASDATALQVNPNGAGANFYVRGFGTSKFNNDMFPGTTGRNVCRQIDVDVQAKGFHLAREGLAPMWNARAIYLQGVFGKVDLGAVSTFGIGRGYEIEYCDGDQTVNYIGGDGCLLYEFSRGGRLLQTDTDRLRPGYIENPDDGAYRPGNGPGTRAVSVAGGSYSTIVDNSADPTNRVNTLTRTWIIPFAGADDDVYKGTPIKIGDQWVTATEFIQGRSNGQVVVGTITGITNASQAVITSPGSGAQGTQLKVGMFIGITGVPGMLIAGGPSSINGRSGQILEFLNDNQFKVAINTSAMTAYGPGTGGNIIPQLEGVPYIDHTPLSAPAAQGASVYVEEFTRVKQLSLTSSGGETGLRMLHASADNLDMHGLRSAYKYGALLTDARATLKGPLPTTVGSAEAVNAKAITAITKANPAMVTCPNHGMTGGSTKVTIDGVVGMTQINGKSATIVVFNANQFTFAVNTTSYSDYVSGGTATQTREDYTIQGDAKSLFSMSDGTILDNPKVAYHVFMTRDDVTGAMGHVDLRNCRIENISRLMLGSKSSLRYGLSMHGCVDTQKNQNLSHPARQGKDFDEKFTISVETPPGSGTFVDVPVGFGYYHFAEDAKLHCWARGIVTEPAISEITGPTLWANSTVYALNALARDPAGTGWKCAVAHTSPAAPTTFAAYRTANPTHWVADVVTTRIVAKYRWYFPARFNAGGDTVYAGGNITTNYDPTVFRNLRFITGSSVYCDIEVVGGAVGTTYSIQADAVGRYFDE